MISSVFQCVICIDKAVDAKLCPSCKHFFCFQCISKWINDDSHTSSCPSCRSPITIDTLIAARFVAEIDSSISKYKNKQLSIKNKKNNTSSSCTKHLLEYTYYCLDCNEPVCSDCALFETTHSSHKSSLKRLSSVHSSHLESIQSQAQPLYERLRELRLIVRDLIHFETVLEKSRNEAAEKINKYLASCLQLIEEQAIDQSAALSEQKKSLEKEIDYIETVLSSLHSQLDTLTPAQLICSQSQLISKLKKATLDKPVTHLDDSLLIFDTLDSSPHTPPYHHGFFRMQGFTELRTKRSVIFSDPLLLNGSSFCLKVYPNGNGSGEGSYLSIFLEMTSGITGSSGKSSHEYMLQVINEVNPYISVSREYSSDFELGECWGYNRFISHETIETKNFIRDVDDSILIRFSIRPLTFTQMVSDQKKYTSRLERLIQYLYNNQVTSGDTFSPAALMSSPHPFYTNTQDRGTPLYPLTGPTIADLLASFEKIHDPLLDPKINIPTALMDGSALPRPSLADAPSPSLSSATHTSLISERGSISTTATAGTLDTTRTQATQNEEDNNINHIHHDYEHDEPTDKRFPAPLANSQNLQFSLTQSKFLSSIQEAQQDDDNNFVLDESRHQSEEDQEEEAIFAERIEEKEKLDNNEFTEPEHYTEELGTLTDELEDEHDDMLEDFALDPPLDLFEDLPHPDYSFDETDKWHIQLSPTTPSKQTTRQPQHQQKDLFEGLNHDQADRETLLDGMQVANAPPMIEYLASKFVQQKPLDVINQDDDDDDDDDETNGLLDSLIDVDLTTENRRKPDV